MGVCWGLCRREMTMFNRAASQGPLEEAASEARVTLRVTAGLVLKLWIYLWDCFIQKQVLYLLMWISPAKAYGKH